MSAVKQSGEVPPVVLCSITCAAVHHLDGIPFEERAAVANQSREFLPTKSDRKCLDVRSVVGGVHAGVARTLRKPVAFSQDRSASRTDGAEVRPYLPDQVTPTALHERCGSIQVRCLKVLAVHHEVGHKVRLLRRRCRSLR